MKTKNSPFGIRYAVLILVLSSILVSGSNFAQGQTQFAYTTGNDTGKVSQIRTSDNTETGIVQVTQFFRPLGIALTDDDLSVFVANDACSGANQCVSRIDITPAFNKVTGIVTGRTAQFVATTPPLPVVGGCRLAYVTTGQQYISKINVCNNAVLPEVVLPDASAVSTGISLANFPFGSPEIWVTDAIHPKVYVIHPSGEPIETMTLTCPDGCTGACCPPSTPLPQHIAYAYISSSEYRMYVTDGAGGNKAVWVIATINGMRQPPRPIRWTDPADFPFTAPYGIGIDPVNSRAYVTAPGDNNKLYTISIPSNITSRFDFFAPAFATPRGVAYISSSNKAYVGNQTSAQYQLTIVDLTPVPPTFSTKILMGGHPYWIAVTTGTYSGSPSWPAPENRIH